MSAKYLSPLATTLCLSGLLTSCALGEPTEPGVDTDVATQAVTAPTVHAPAGQFLGNQANGVKSFRGIAYAEPPVGALRWQPPVKAADRHGVTASACIGDRYCGHRHVHLFGIA